jgi:hypothetical protein
MRYSFRTLASILLFLANHDILWQLAKARILFVGFGLELNQSGMTSHQSELFLISRVFWYIKQLLKWVASQYIDLYLSKISFIEQLYQSICKVSLVGSDWSKVFYENCSKILTNGSKVHISHDRFKQFVELEHTDAIYGSMDN